MPYIYQSDCWCDSCGEAIATRLRANASEAEIIDWSDERYYDSDEYPKWMNADEEWDSPQHCGSGPDCLEYVQLSDRRKIGALLSISLTSDGEVYVQEQVAIDPDNPVCQFWKEQFSWIDWPDEDDAEDNAVASGDADSGQGDR